MRARLTRALSLLVFGPVAACGGDGLPPVAPPPGGLAAAPRVGSTLPEYVPNPDGRDTLTVAAGDQTWLVGPGLRAAYRKGAPPTLLPGPPLTGARRLPAAQGGGVVFWGKTFVYRATSFEAPLRALRSFPGQVAQVLAHPEGLLVLHADGRALIDRETGEPKPMSPRGLAEVATVEGGSLARLALGDVARWEAGAWKPLALPEPSMSIFPAARDAGTDLGIRTETKTLRVGADGLLVEGPPPKPERPVRLGADPSWTGGAPLAAAVLGGVPWGGVSALWLGPGGLYEVNLADGQPTLRAKDVVPPAASSCELALAAGPAGSSPANGSNLSAAAKDDFGPIAELRSPFGDGPEWVELGEPILLCSTPQGALVVGGLLSKPIVEQRLPGPGTFFVGDDGALAYLARAVEPGAKKEPPQPPTRGKPSRPPAIEDPNELTVWTRTGSGTWTEQPVSSALAVLTPPRAPKDEATEDDPEAEEPPVPAVFLRPVPTQTGSLMLFRRADRLYQVDPSRSVAHELSLRELSGSVSGFLHSLADRKQRHGAVAIDRSVSARPGGGLSALWERTAFEVGPDAVVRDLTRSFSRVSTHGPRGLGRTRDGLLQTVDRGRHWVEVEDAPVEGYELRCGAVGCVVGSQLRLGWRSTPPADKRARVAASAAPKTPSPALPVLSCLASGPATFKVQVPTRALPDGVPSPAFGLGASELQPPAGAGRGMFGEPEWVVSRLRLGWTDGTQAPLVLAVTPQLFTSTGGMSPKLHDRIVHSVELFDPAGTIRRGAQRLAPLVAQYGNRAVDPQGLEITEVIPILPPAPEPGKRWQSPQLLFGFPYQTDAGGAFGLWNGREMAIAWDEGADGLTQAAVAVAGGTIVLRMAGAVRRLTARGGSPLRDLPSFLLEELDTLAVRPDGSVWLLRLPSGGQQPEPHDPALLLPLLGGDLVPRPLDTAASLALAPWSSLTLASDPACRGDLQGARAMVSLPAGWVRWQEAGGLLGDELGPMRALVRWSPERVCLEAIETAMRSSWVAGPDVLVARWDDPPSASQKKATNASVLQIERGSEGRAPRRCGLAKP